MPDPRPSDPRLPDPRLPDPDLRAADADRQGVAAVLGRHMADGRLTVEEYEERLARAYAARTYGELGVLLADLPGPGAPRPATAPAPARAVAHRSPGCAARQRSAWAAWLTTALVVTTVWLVTTVTTGVHPFWPVWVIGPWGAVLLARTLGGGPHPSAGRRRS